MLLHPISFVSCGLLALLFFISPTTTAQMPELNLEEALPKGAYILQSSFQERALSPSRLPYHIDVDKGFYPAVLEKAEAQKLVLYRDPMLRKPWDLQELRRLYMAAYAEEYQDFLDGGDDPNDSFAQAVELNPLAGTAGFVESFKLSSKHIDWERISAFVSWGDWESPENAITVYFDADSPELPLDKLRLRRLARGYAEADLDHVLHHHLYRLYPELAILPGGRELKRLNYNPLPGASAQSVDQEWQDILGATPESVFAAQAGHSGFKTKSDYKIWIESDITHNNTIPGIVPKEPEKLQNKALLEEVVTQLMDKFRKGELEAYWPDDRERAGSFAELHATVEEDEMEFGDFDDDAGWGEEEPFDWRSVDLEAFQREMYVIGSLVQERGEIRYEPEGLVLVYNDGARYTMGREVAYVKLAGAGLSFQGVDLATVLQGSSFHWMLLKIQDRRMLSREEAFYVDWCLRQNWQRIPDYAAFKEMVKAGKAEGLLREMYQKQGR